MSTEDWQFLVMLLLVLFALAIGIAGLVVGVLALG
jgi:hypothetical protein